jgi:hypothetical protein
VGVLVRVKDDVWKEWCLRHQTTKEYAYFSPQPIVSCPNCPPYEGYVMLTFPFYWWRLDEVERCSEVVDV